MNFASTIVSKSGITDFIAASSFFCLAIAMGSFVTVYTPPKANAAIAATRKSVITIFIKFDSLFEAISLIILIG